MSLPQKYPKPRKQTKIIKRRKSKILEKLDHSPGTRDSIAKSKDIPGSWEDKQHDCNELLIKGKLGALNYSNKLDNFGKSTLIPLHLPLNEIAEKLNPDDFNEYQKEKLVLARQDLYNTVNNNHAFQKSLVNQKLLQKKKLIYTYPLNLKKDLAEQILEKFVCEFRLRQDLTSSVLRTINKRITPIKWLIADWQIYETIQIANMFIKFLEDYYPSVKKGKKVPKYVYKSYSATLNVFHSRDSYIYNIFKTGKHTLYDKVIILINHLEGDDIKSKREYGIKTNKGLWKIIDEITDENRNPNIKKIKGLKIYESAFVPLIKETPNSLISKLEKLSKKQKKKKSKTTIKRK